jgi:hypothetical protein
VVGPNDVFRAASKCTTGGLLQLCGRCAWHEQVSQPLEPDEGVHQATQSCLGALHHGRDIKIPVSGHHCTTDSSSANVAGQSCWSESALCIKLGLQSWSDGFPRCGP